MSMHYRSHVGPVTVDKKVHGNFAGNVATSCNLVAVGVNHDEVFRRHHPFTHQRGSTEKGAVVQAHREVAVGCSHQTSLMQEFSVADDFVLVLVYRLHGLECW